MFKTTGKLLMTFGVGVLSNIFDVYDIARSSLKLANCLDTQKCNEREIEMHSVNIALSGVSLAVGIAALIYPQFAPIALLILSLIFVFNEIYTTSSFVRDFSEKYDITFTEKLDLFFLTLILMESSENIKAHATRKELMTHLLNKTLR